MNRCRCSCARKMNFSLRLSPFEIRRHIPNRWTREENVWNNQLTKRLHILRGTRAVSAIQSRHLIKTCVRRNAFHRMATIDMITSNESTVTMTITFLTDHFYGAAVNSRIAPQSHQDIQIINIFVFSRQLVCVLCDRHVPFFIFNTSPNDRKWLKTVETTLDNIFLWFWWSLCRRRWRDLNFNALNHNHFYLFSEFDLLGAFIEFHLSLTVSVHTLLIAFNFVEVSKDDEIAGSQFIVRNYEYYECSWRDHCSGYVFAYNSVDFMSSVFDKPHKSPTRRPN